MKIVFISGVKFGLELLTTILENGWEIDTVFSYDDSKRISHSDYASFDKITETYGIRHIKVQNINDSQNVNMIRTITPDLILVMGWSQLLKNEILSIPRIGVIGSHPTLLPKYRGRSPIPWTIIKGLKESALTFFYMTEGADDGDILDQCKFEISDHDDASSLYGKIIDLGKIMLLENLKLFEKGLTKRIPQDESKFIEFWPKRVPEDGKIDWSKNGKEIHTLIRATTHPYPGAFTYFKKSKLSIWKSQYSDGNSRGAGKITDITKEGVKIGTGNGSILLKIVSIDNGSETDAINIISREDIGTTLE